MIKYGYVSEQEPFANHLNYNGKRREFFHPWSIKNVGITFGAREYSKYIPLHEYIKMPFDLSEDLLEGVMEGDRIATQARIDAAKREAERSGAKDPAQVALDKYNKRGK